MITYPDIVAAARADDRTLVHVERDGAVATVTLDDPDRLNPLSATLTVQLRDHVDALAADPEVRAVVLTGTDPGFCAGGDLTLMRDVAQPMLEAGEEGAADLWRWIRHQFGGIARTIVRSDTAFISAVNGPAAGVGMSLPLSCDLVVLSERARLVLAFGGVGLIPEVGTSWLLTRRLGHQGAFALLASGGSIGPAEAKAAGLATEVVPHDALMATATAWAHRVAALPPHVAEMGKAVLRQAADMTWEQAIALEEIAEPSAFTTRAHRDGVTALLAR